MDVAGEDGDKDEPVSDPSAKSTWDPHDNRCGARPAFIEDGQVGAEHAKWEKITIMAVSPLES